MLIISTIKKHENVVRVVAAAGIAVMALSFILIRQGEKKTVLEIDVDAKDISDIPFKTDDKE